MTRACGPQLPASDVCTVWLPPEMPQEYSGTPVAPDPSVAKFRDELKGAGQVVSVSSIIDAAVRRARAARARRTPPSRS